MAELAPRKCEMCGQIIHPDRDEWALDKHGDALCRPCHIKAVLLLKGQGVDWEGESFGYELGPAEEFGDLPPEEFGFPDNLSASAPMKKVGRNEQCPCGSGKKFKKCCGQ